MRIDLSRSFSSTHLSMFVIGTLASGVSPIGYGGSDPELGSVQAAVTEDQSNFFEVNGHVQICHRTSSVAHPFTIIKTSVQGCINGHADHAEDYIAEGSQAFTGANDVTL